MATRRLRTANPDALDSLNALMRGVAGLARQMADLDYAAEGAADKTRFPGSPEQPSERDLERADHADFERTAEYASLRAEADVAQMRMAGQRLREAAKTAAFDRNQKNDDVARQARVAASRADADLHSNTSLVRALVGG